MISTELTNYIIHSLQAYRLPAAKLGAFTNSAMSSQGEPGPTTADMREGRREEGPI